MEAPGPRDQRPNLSFSGDTMGVRWNVTLSVTSPTNGTATAVVLQGIQETLARVDGRMSTYKPESEISRFAVVPAGHDFEVSAETADVIREAQRIASLSSGAFDVTVMPLVDLWGFGPAQAAPTAPSDSELEAALASCGWQKLHVGATSLRKDVDNLKVDLSAIAKGYGVDAVCATLEENGYTDYMVEVGGEVRTAGHSPSGRAWRIGIDRPQDMSSIGQELQTVLELGSIAVATSGDYRNFRIVDGKRVSHTIDPRTGKPVEHSMASVTVLAPNCMLADALATTCMVAGPLAGMMMIEQMDGVECFLITRSGDKLVASTSSGLKVRRRCSV